MEDTLVKNLIIVFVIYACWHIVLPAFSSENDRLNAERILSDIEEKLQLSKEKLDKLKPALAAKSAELQKGMQESVDKGFVEFEKFSDTLDTLSERAVKDMQEALTGEEMQQLKEYLGKLDKESIDRVKDTLVEEFSALLDLTEEQARKVKPIVEDSLLQLSQVVERYAKEGAKSLQEFKAEYDKLVGDLREKLKDILNKGQMDSFEKHNKELKEKAKETVIAI